MSDVVQLYDEADALKEQGKLEKAVEKLKEALAVDETYALAHSALGILLQKLGQNEEALQRVALRMATDEAQERYRRRAWIAETPFAIIKAALGIRRFLLRGLEKVNIEWDWICSAFNLGKLVRLLAATRAASAAAMA